MSGRARVRLLLLLACACLWIGTAKPRASAQQPFRTGTQAVTVDVVVRDKGGHPVLDLGRDDFEIFEDGVLQQVSDFTAPPAAAPAGTPGSPARADAAAPAAGAPSGPMLMALVFGRLSPEGRGLAQRAVQAYLASRTGADDLGAVFSLDRGLNELQDFTSDSQTLGRAFERALTRATDGPPAASPYQTTPSAEHRAPLLPGLSASQQAPDMEGFGLEPEFEARLTLQGLSQLVSALASIPGRKTIVFFAEALTVYPEIEPYFQSLIDLANRSNVSIYPMDAAGLRAHSQTSEFANALNSNVQAALNSTGDVRPDPAYMTTLMGMLRSGNTPAILSVLARETGGLPIAQTNDLARGFERINEDRHAYYLLTYSPTNANFRGERRQIAVRVKRPDVTVRARSGYLAVRDAPREPIAAYEIPAFNALARTPAAREIPVEVGGYAFPLPSGAYVAPLVVRVPARFLTFDEERDEFRAEATIVAVIRNASGAIVRRGSQAYRLVGPRRELETKKGSTLSFYRHPALPPGHYTIEAAIADTRGAHAGVGRALLDVPTSSGHVLRVSSLVMIAQGEKLATADRLLRGNPMVYHGALLMPNPAPTISRRVPQSTFFLTIVPGDQEPTRATLALLQDEQTLTQVDLALAKPDADGQIQHAGQIPTGQLAPGRYQARVVVSHGRAHETRETTFVIE